jgi:hypothetical protein
MATPDPPAVPRPPDDRGDPRDTARSRNEPNRQPHGVKLRKEPERQRHGVELRKEPTRQPRAVDLRNEPKRQRRGAAERTRELVEMTGFTLATEDPTCTTRP